MVAGLLAETLRRGAARVQPGPFHPQWSGTFLLSAAAARGSPWARWNRARCFDNLQAAAVEVVAQGRVPPCGLAREPSVAGTAIDAS